MFTVFPCLFLDHCDDIRWNMPPSKPLHLPKYLTKPGKSFVLMNFGPWPVVVFVLHSDDHLGHSTDHTACLTQQVVFCYVIHDTPPAVGAYTTVV